MLGRQQQLVLLVEKDQQVLQMGKTITKRNICTWLEWREGAGSNNNNNKEKYLYPYALRGCVRPVRIVPLNNICLLLRPFSLLQCLLFFDTVCPLEKNQILTPLGVISDYHNISDSLPRICQNDASKLAPSLYTRHDPRLTAREPCPVYLTGALK
jgi:hypothetical protein